MTYVVLKPQRLSEGDTVAVLSPSSGLPSVFPRVYELGLRNLREKFGLRVKEYPTARADKSFLYENPGKRAEDVNNAFADEEVKAILASIGGDDSLRILPFLDKDVIVSNPKILMGYSDTTTLLTHCNELGLVTFHGPSIMAGFSQLTSLPAAFTEHIRTMLFTAAPTFEYEQYDSYSDGYPDFSREENLGKVRAQKKSDGWHWLQGETTGQGRLFGGNIEVLEWLKGTPYWPPPSFWEGKILFLETSEEKPPPIYVARWLRSFAAQGLLDRIDGLLFGRARDYSEDEKKRLDKNVISVVAGECERPKMPIISNMDFGHTDPQLILPLGINAQINPKEHRLRLLEPVVT